MHIRFIDDVDDLLQIILIRIRIRQNAGEAFGASVQCVFAHFIELGQQLFIEFAEHLAKNLQTQIHFLFEGSGKIALSGPLVPVPDETIAASAGVICSFSIVIRPPSPNHRVARSVGPSRHLRDCFGRLLRAHSPKFGR